MDSLGESNEISVRVIKEVRIACSSQHTLYTEAQLRALLAVRMKEESRRALAAKLNYSEDYLTSIKFGRKAMSEDFAAKLGFQRVYMFIPIIPGEDEDED